MVKNENRELRIASGISVVLLSLFAAGYSLLPPFLYGQQPQTQSAPLYSVNARYVNGSAPGYWSTAGLGLTLNISAGTVICGNPPAPVSYVGGTLTMAANQTNYVYLDPTNSCLPASNATGFAIAVIPIAKVQTTVSSIATIIDMRTFGLRAAPCTVASGGSVVCSPLGVGSLVLGDVPNYSNFLVSAGKSVTNPIASTNSASYFTLLQSPVFDQNASESTPYSGYVNSLGFGQVVQGSGNISGMIDVLGTSYYAGTATLTDGVYGAGMYPQIRSGTAPNLTAYYSQPIQRGGSVSSAYGIFADTPDKTSGTLNNLYGIYVGDQIQGTNNWAIKTGSGLVEFGDTIKWPGALNSTSAVTISAGGSNQPINLNPTGTAHVCVPPANANVLDASCFSGADAGAKIAAAIAALPARGGTVDARGLDGAQIISVDMFNGTPVPVQLLLDIGTYSISTTQTIRAPGTAVLGVSVGDSTSNPTSGTILKWTGASKGLMFDAQNADNLHFANLTIDANGLLSRAFQFGGTVAYGGNTAGLVMESVHVATEPIRDDTVTVSQTGLSPCAVELYSSGGSLQDSMFIDTKFWGNPCGVDSGVGDTVFIRSQFSSDNNVYGFVMGSPSGSLLMVSPLFTNLETSGLHIAYAGTTLFGDLTLVKPWFEGGNGTTASVQVLKRVGSLSPQVQANGVFISSPKFGTVSASGNLVDLTGLIMEGLILRDHQTVPGSDVGILNSSGSTIRLEEQSAGPGLNVTGPGTVAYFVSNKVQIAGPINVQDNAQTGYLTALQRAPATDAIQVGKDANGVIFGTPLTVGNLTAGDVEIPSGKCYRSENQYHSATFKLVCSDASDNVVIGGDAAGTIIGPGGGLIHGIKLYATGTVTPTAVSGQTCSDQAFAVTGLVSDERISNVTPPSALGNASLNAYAQSGSVLLHFCNPSTSSVTPPAGVYSFVAIR